MTKMYFSVPALLGLTVVLGGCAHERHEAIPANAMEVSEAQGDVKYTAPEDGEVYVYNGNEDELIYSGRIRKGETISLEPEDDEDKIRIDSQVISTRDLNEGDKHKIFFKPDTDRQRSADLASDREGRVVTEEKTTIIRDDAVDVQTEPQKKTVTETETRTTEGGNVVVEEKTTTETKP